MSDKSLTQFTSQLSTLQDAGLPIVRSLKILEGQMKPRALQVRLVGSVTEDVESRARRSPTRWPSTPGSSTTST